MRELRSWLRWHRLDGDGGERHMSLMGWLMVASVVALGTAGVSAYFLSVGSAHAQSTCPSGWTTAISGTTITCSHTFTSTGQEQSFAVLPGVSQLSISAVGGAGAGFNIVGSGAGGHGAVVNAVISTSALPAGTSTLYVEVGANGSGAAGGWNGGGQGSSVPSTGNGGGGGGASDVRSSSCGAACGTSADTTLGARLLVAGGGGGGGDGGFSICNGGCGIPTGGNGGTGPASDDSGGYTFDGAGGSGGGATNNLNGGSGGGGGTATAGGAGGSGGAGINPGASGALGAGGAGSSQYGGGGGGGYYGGGGGGGGAFKIDGEFAGSGGGGAGSSFVIANAMSASVEPDPTGAPEIAVSYALPAKATTVTLASSANASNVGQEVTFTATINPAPDGGTVSFSQFGSLISCSAESQALSNGVATCTITYSGAGSYNITASYSGDDNFASSGSGLTQQVNRYSPTLTTTANPASAAFGAALNDSATLSGGANPSGTITFNLYAPGASPCRGCGFSPIYSNTVTAPGDGAYSTATGTNPGGYVATSLGTYQWVAIYSGDATNNGLSTPFGSEPVTVSKADTTANLAMTSPAQPSGLPAGVGVSVVGQQATFTATIAEQAPSTSVPTGTVTFTDGATTLCSNTSLSSNGTATCSAPYAAAGTHDISASYTGDGGFNGSSGNLTLYVNTDISHYLQNGVYNLRNVNLAGGFFVGENLSGANLANSAFSNATFSYANLSGANLSNAKLTDANLTGANLTNANLSQANLQGANLTGAILKGATGMASANLKGLIWSDTTCPDGANSDAHNDTCAGHL